MIRPCSRLSRRRLLVPPVMVTAGLLFAVTAEAQIPAVDALLKKVKGVGIWAGPAWFTGSAELDAAPARDVGIEGSISLATRNDWSFELDISFEQFAGFRAKNPTLDLRARIEALPGATFYVSPPFTFGPDGDTRVYVGINVGQAKLVDAKAFDSAGQEFSLTGASAQFGTAIGFVNLTSGFFVEFSYRNRIFESLTFSSASNATVPAGWPRSLDASIFSVRFGFQYFIRDEGTNAAGGAQP